MDSEKNWTNGLQIYYSRRENSKLITNLSDENRKELKLRISLNKQKNTGEI